MLSFTTFMPVKELLKYREFDRVNKPAPRIPFIQAHDVDEVTEWVRLNGITKPLRLAVFDTKALLFDGNHRIVAADRLGIEIVPVEVTYYDTVNELQAAFDDHSIQRFRQIN